MMEIKKLIVKLAAYYEKTLTDEQVEMYSKQMADHLTAQDVSVACKKYIDDPANEFFPRPMSKLIALVRSPVSQEALAHDSASKIKQAVSDCGYSDPIAARAFIGEIGWEIVRRSGGWSFICENLGTNKMPVLTFYAQSRDLAKSLGEIKKSVDFENHLLESNEKNNVLKIDHLIKTIGGKKL